MLYWIGCRDDGTEIAATEVSESGKALIYVDRYDGEMDKVASATILLPDMVLIPEQDCDGQDLRDVVQEIGSRKDEIMDRIRFQMLMPPPEEPEYSVGVLSLIEDLSAKLPGRQDLLRKLSIVYRQASVMPSHARRRTWDKVIADARAALAEAENSEAN